MLERGVWSFEVRGPRFQEASLSGSIDVDATRRMVDHNMQDPPERLQIRGAANLTGRVSGDDWEAQAYLPVLFDRSAGLASAGIQEQRDWDLGGFLVQGRKGPFGVRVGHFSPEPPSLIMEGFLSTWGFRFDPDRSSAIVSVSVESAIRAHHRIPRRPWDSRSGPKGLRGHPSGPTSRDSGRRSRPFSDLFARTHWTWRGLLRAVRTPLPNLGERDRMERPGRWTLFRLAASIARRVRA